MSGGVDSAVAAYLLKEAGHDVIGITLRTWVASDGTESRCCEIDDARRVARRLDIPYHTYNCLSDFKKYVTDPFIRSYMCGETPNPCILCNRHVKWDRMMYLANVLQADYIATGHYASVVRTANGRFSVKRSLHTEKDQSYMLCRLTQEQLAATLMPLGNLSKQEVRSIAEQADIPVAAKRDSQEICFVPDGNYADYIEENTDAPVSGEGFFVDEKGSRIGKHKGIIHYTVGQRKGLGLAMGHPVYVNRICPDTNEVVVGDEQSLYRTRIFCDDVSYMSIPGLEKGQAMNSSVKVRYHHAPQDAVIEALGDGRIMISFSEPVRAPAPGQSAVFYDENDCVIGAATITKS